MFSPPDPTPEPAAESEAYQAHVAAMITELEAVRDLPELPAFKQTRSLPEAFFTHFNRFLHHYEELIGLALAAGGGDRIECRKGCSNCCIDLVRGITTAEIVNIYRHVREWPDARALFEYHRDSAVAFMEILAGRIGPNDPPPRGDDPRVAEAHVAYNRKNRPCGFLDQETGCCRIYPVRPVACRYFFSFDPPETCSPLHMKYLNREVRLVHLPPEVHALLREVNQRFELAMPNFLSGAFCELTAAVMKTKPIEVKE